MSRYYNIYDNELYHYGVIGMRWGIRHDKQYKSDKNSLKKQKKIGKINKEQYKQKLNNAKVSAANRLYGNTSAKSNTKIATDSTAKTLAKTLLLSSYGAKKYNDSRAKGDSRSISAIKGYGYTVANTATLGSFGNMDYSQAIKQRDVVSKGTKRITSLLAIKNIANSIAAGFTGNIVFISKNLASGITAIDAAYNSHTKQNE